MSCFEFRAKAYRYMGRWCSCQFYAALMMGLFMSLANATEPNLIRHYDKGYSPLLRVYLTDILTTVLDKTVSEYGPYEIDFYSQYLSSNRSKLETERGVLLDLLFSTHWHGRFVNPDNVVQIEFPVFEGLLGLRSLIITRERNEQFNQVQSTEELLRFSAGQGSSWTDIDVLRANNISIVEAQLFDGLFPMLSKHRYDYLPLSVLEAQTALHTKGLKYNDLMINDSVYLFYPMPFYLYVNASKPELANRLRQGLAIAQRDGSIQRLFKQHFHYVKPILQAETKKLIVLQNPFMSAEENRDVVASLLDNFPDVFKVLP